MISYNDKIKINDFREAYKKIMNPHNNKYLNETIDALFYNVECNYEEYCATVPYVSANQEQYPFHILKPVNGQYSLLDFLLNRAISNVDCIYPCDENAYDHAKILLINTQRYEKERPKYSEDFINKQYHKSKLHETGHALHIWDTTKDNSIHSRDSYFEYSNFVGFKQKLQGFEKHLCFKYPNMLHSFEIANTPQTAHSTINQSYPFASHNIDESATEYFATKYSGLYKDTSTFDAVSVNAKNKFLMLAVPNHFNGYAHSSHFIYHLENLVSKSAMFESMFFENDIALREFSNKCASQIEKIWSRNSYLKLLPDFKDSFSKFNYLFQTACNHNSNNASKQVQSQTMLAHQLLDWIFLSSYHQEFTKGNISVEQMMEIAKLSYSFSPVIYDSEKKEHTFTPIKLWYKDIYAIMKDRKDKKIPPPVGR